MINRDINQLYGAVLNEIRIILDSERHSGQENPTVRQYKSLLERYLDKIQKGKSQGVWVTSCFLYADTSESLDQLKALTKSAFSGRNSIPDRIRTINTRVKTYPGLIHNSAPASPGQFTWPYMYSTIHTTSDLGSIIKPPCEEFPGYKIKPFVRFNLSKTDKGEIEIGEILDQGERTGKKYSISRKSLKKHGLIVGGTGSGKTNTIFYMLRWLLNEKIPFLVMEPAKKEYRKLLFDEGFKEKLQVFTLGDNNVSPFRLNPFTVFEGIQVQTHLDLLKSVFNSSFYMWGPLPHVLEQCLYEVYRDKGWDLTSNRNMRGEGVNSYPTLTDLYNKVDDVVNRLGYSPETTMELKSSLKTRLNSLRVGGKGLMLDTRNCVNFKDLLSKPTIIELETLGDDDEKSFMMGLILTMMYEYYISEGFFENIGLRHLTVIEEAHRLLGSTGKDSAFTGDMKGKAVETFTNILSEIRAYGEGFLIAEQIPTKLSTDVVKNTNLKVMHRVVADDDRNLMASAMNVKREEAPMASTLSVGEALTYSEGDDGAYFIKVPYAKLGTTEGIDEDRVVRECMRDYLQDMEYLAPYTSCPAFCSNICLYKDVGGEISRIFSIYYPRVVLSLVVEEDVENNLVRFYEAGKDEGIRVGGDHIGVSICAVVQGAEYYFETLGRRYHWDYSIQREIVTAFLDVVIPSLVNIHEKSELMLDEGKNRQFQELFKASVMDKQPYRQCKVVCRDGSCQYRYLLKAVLEDSYYHDKFTATINEGSSDMWTNLRKICMEAVSELNPMLTADEVRLISGCFAIQKTHSLEEFSPQHIEIVLRNIWGDLDRLE
jgi:hypothetical protein